ncbi:dynein heavy chain axonemal [Brachionus plicatilis]|uniref:Dynein heavy chain axonemal n=1 Tax=Brachionus plicatilis TaxID=10195 RepID=A0A3M7SDZ3_BRAPC|nr:dynein heavy chain axonemal [Brachionus plicatilis]
MTCQLIFKIVKANFTFICKQHELLLHWDRISDDTKHPIDIENDELKLRNIMEASLLDYKEEIEDI